MNNTPDTSLKEIDSKPIKNTKSFSDFNLHENIQKALKKIDYTTPTPIQEQTIHLALENHDIIGAAQTGTGKTAAFILPVINKLLNNPQDKALVLAPTRELATQIMDFVYKLINKKTDNLKTALLIGGMSMHLQLRQIKANARLIVGTPGRVYDHLTQKHSPLKLDRVTSFVLDEADRMLDMGFSVQIDAISEFLPKNKQMLMFSATMPPKLNNLTKNYMNNPKHVEIKATNKTRIKIKESHIKVSEKNKYEKLMEELETREGSIIIFSNTKANTEKLCKQLRSDDFSADYIHGDLRQRQRDSIIRNFRNYKFQIIVATDVAARGLDIPHIEHVINYDIPTSPEDYVHRIGRTGRAGESGEALSFISKQDERRWFDVECFLDPEKKKSASHNKFANKKPSGRSGRFKRGGSSKEDIFGSKKPNNRSSSSSSSNRSERSERSDRPGRSDRFEKSDRPARSDRSDRPARSDRSDRPARSDRSDRPARSDRSERPARSDRSDRPARSDRPGRSDRFERSDRPGRSDNNFPKGKNRSSNKNNTRDNSSGKPRRDSRTA